MRQVFVCTTGFPGHWEKVMAEHRAHGMEMTDEEQAARMKDQPEHANGHVGLHCGETIGGDLFQLFQARLAELKLPDVMLTPNACIAQHVAGPIVMVYPEGVWYRLTDIAQADEIIQEHLVNGRIVEHLVHRRLDPGNRSKGVTPIKVPARA